MGIPVLPPDVGSSGLDFTAKDREILFGLSAIKNVGEAAIRSILDARDRTGRPTSLYEMCSEIDLRLVNKRVLEALVASGALDSLGARRSQLSAAVDTALEIGQKRRVEREAGQASLFAGGTTRAGEGRERDVLPDVPDWDERTRLAHEKATLGFYVTGHPLASYRELLADFATHASTGLEEPASGTDVAVGGVITDRRRRKSKKGAWWASFQLEDLDGLVEVLVFPKAYETCSALLENDRAVLVSGRVENDDDRPRILAEEITPLDELRERRAQAVQLRLDAAELDDDEVVARLRRAVESHRGDVALYLEVVRPGGFRMLARAEANLRVAPSRALSLALEQVLGPGRVHYRARTGR
jgi:DNA polymerase-3 subunit alpha